MEVYDVEKYNRGEGFVILPDHRRNHAGIATCGQCGRSWDDSIPTSTTPAPSARCPFEYDHAYDDSVPRAVSVFIPLRVSHDLGCACREHGCPPGYRTHGCACI